MYQVHHDEQTERINAVEQKIRALTGRLTTVIDRAGHSLHGNMEGSADRLERMEKTVEQLTDKVRELCEYQGVDVGTLPALPMRPHLGASPSAQVVYLGLPGPLGPATFPSHIPSAGLNADPGQGASRGDSAPPATSSADSLPASSILLGSASLQHDWPTMPGWSPITARGAHASSLHAGNVTDARPSSPSSPIFDASETMNVE